MLPQMILQSASLPPGEPAWHNVSVEIAADRSYIHDAAECQTARGKTNSVAAVLRTADCNIDPRHGKDEPLIVRQPLNDVNRVVAQRGSYAGPLDAHEKDRQTCHEASCPHRPRLGLHDGDNSTGYKGQRENCEEGV